MADFQNLILFAYYLNSNRLAPLASTTFPAIVHRSLAQNNGERAYAMHGVSSVAESLLRSGPFQNLTKVVGTQDVEGQRILGFVWASFTFSGAALAIATERDGKPHQNAKFEATLSLGAADYHLFGEMHNEHYFSSSSISILTNKHHMLIAGHFEFHGNNVEVFPYIIGEVVEESAKSRSPLANMIRVYPQSIDAFAQIAQRPRPTPADLAAIGNMPEADVKQAFADIVGEPFVSKDWGGEKSDLVTSHLTIGGEPTSAAFIFKGPSVPGPLHPANMGKRGDQLIRAFDEPVDLIVVQHCNKIETSVVKNAEGLAYDARRPRRYCIIDGGDTARILKTYGKLPSN